MALSDLFEMTPPPPRVEYKKLDSSKGGEGGPFEDPLPLRQKGSPGPPSPFRQRRSRDPHPLDKGGPAEKKS